VRLPVLSAALLAGMMCGPALCQPGPPVDPATQPHKEWELPRRPATVVGDGSIDDTRVLPYLQQLTDRLSGGLVPIRLTRSPKQYAAISASRGVDLSAGMLGRIEDEAELAGLIAHELAHLPRHSVCLLDPHATTPAQDSRVTEREATTLAVSTLKTAGYDPTSLLSLLLKLGYENPTWGKAIDSDDLLEMRAKLDNEPLPTAGLRLDSSAFVQAHAVVVAMLPKSKRD
jgi:hypothetical protein